MELMWKIWHWLPERCKIGAILQSGQKNQTTNKISIMPVTRAEYEMQRDGFSEGASPLSEASRWF